jgi:hypothetical protein
VYLLRQARAQPTLGLLLGDPALWWPDATLCCYRSISWASTPLHTAPDPQGWDTTPHKRLTCLPTAACSQVATADSLVSAMTGLGPSASRAATPSGHHSHPQQQQQQQQQQEGSPTGSTGAALPPPCAAALSQAAAHGGGDAASEAGSCRSGVAAQHKRPGTASVVSCGSSVRSSVVADLQQQLAQAQAERAALQQQLEAIKAEKGLGHSSPAGKSKPGPSNLGKAAGGSGSSCASVASRPMTTAALARLQGPGSSA